MLVLAVDAGSDNLSIAVGAPGGRKVVRSAAGARRHAGLLATLADQAMAEMGIGHGKLDAIAVADGPGSFTGLRVASAWAKGLARPTGIPLWTASTLLIRAARAGEASKVVLAASSALRGEWYAAVYRFAPPGITVLAEPGVVGAHWSPPAPIDAVVADAGLIEAGLEWAKAPLVVGPPDSFPSAERLIDLIGIAGGATRIDDPAGWEPTYGRPAEAQAKWERDHGRPLDGSSG